MKLSSGSVKMKRLKGVKIETKVFWFFREVLEKISENGEKNVL